MGKGGGSEELTSNFQILTFHQAIICLMANEPEERGFGA